MKTLRNDSLTVQISEFGAELTSMRNNATGREYIWQGDPAFWKRHSPVLFPIVGSLWERQYRYKRKLYGMYQHGFARDSKFEIIDCINNLLACRINQFLRFLSFFLFLDLN